MKVSSLLYHDIVDRGDFSTSGFDGPGSHRYKLEVTDLVLHLQALAKRGVHAGSVLDLDPEALAPSSILITFDDGGASAVHVAEMLDRHGWVGHFLVSTAYVGRAGFLQAADLRALDQRGHVIGSHAHRHAEHMGRWRPQLVLDEWRKSRESLEDLLGHEVKVASVPFGHYSRRVAEAAGDAGLRFLFTSEPVRRTWQVGPCTVLGRYSLVRGDSAARASALGSTSGSLSQYTQFVTWTAKKAVKRSMYPVYAAVRHRVLDS